MLGFVPQPNLLKRLFAYFCQTTPPNKNIDNVGFRSSTQPTEKAFCLYNIVGWVKRQRHPTKTRIMLGFRFLNPTYSKGFLPTFVKQRHPTKT
ncbi:hypothetical protein [Dapis sp. BLCC M229]|uniref:hypothetical protein n=1 Tax=Dapis sp. BLCC M229 TaxID=3400188 RepID=UPI003CF85B79